MGSSWTDINGVVHEGASAPWFDPSVNWSVDESGGHVTPVVKPSGSSVGSSSSGGSGSGAGSVKTSSSSESAALREFVAANGRQPTASEISAWRAANGGSPGSGGSSGSASSAASNARITTDTDLSLPEGLDWSPPEIASLENQRAQFAESDRLLGDSESILKDLAAKNESWMRGEVPTDVQERLREDAAQSARASGLSGSQAARNLEARDLGLTSMQIQESGMQRAAQLSELQKGLAGIREQRAQYLTSLQENSRQFGASLADQVMRTQLAHRELMLKQDAFNAEQNMRLVELITQSSLGAMQLQVQAATGGVTDDSGITASFNQLQQQLQNLLARSNPTE